MIEWTWVGGIEFETYSLVDGSIGLKSELPKISRVEIGI